ncbi:mercuric transport protein MerTP [Nafulsella turpanensis]|uniref:mercuric transport protein MerTP n=1 Tax=Nafulsella turpanensis TaxID=1265690 RepID=UPI0003474B23|nr:mercuric transport protein MerTP [Nafulsella turpanensis]
MENKKNYTKIMAAGVVAALGASLCCITPILALVAGIGGAASAFAWLDPFRTYLIGFTGVLLAFAWYQQLKPQKEQLACDCEDDQKKKAFVQSKTFLGIATAFALLLLSFPYFSGSFFPESANKVVAAVIQPAQFQQASLKIEGMTCGGCESSVNHALSSKEGVLNAKASYEEGIAKVTYDPALITPEALKKAIEEEVGYIVPKIELIDTKKEY